MKRCVVLPLQREAAARTNASVNAKTCDCEDERYVYYSKSTTIYTVGKYGKRVELDLLATNEYVGLRYVVFHLTCKRALRALQLGGRTFAYPSRESHLCSYRAALRYVLKYP